MSDLAVIAGMGALPGAVLAQDPGAVVCEMAGFPVAYPEGTSVLTYRLETLGTLIADLQARGIKRLCFAGAMSRPAIDPTAIDAATMPLVPRIMAAVAEGGDDAALRAALALFSDAGFAIVGAAELVPDLLPDPGVLTGDLTDQTQSDADRAMQVLDAIAAADLGQGCVVAKSRVIAVEAAPGTEWMLASLRDGEAWGGVFAKAPKIGQDLRVDMPAIGPDTVDQAHQAGLKAIVIAAGGVIVLERAETIARAQQAGITIWVRA